MSLKQLAGGLVLIALTLAPAGSAEAARQGEPVTRPAERRVERDGERGRGPGRLLERLRRATAEMDVTPEQRRDLDAAFEAAIARFRQALPEMRQMSRDERREEVRVLLMGLVDEVNAALPPEKRGEFRATVERLRDRDDDGEARPGRGFAPPPGLFGGRKLDGDAPPPPMMGGDAMSGPDQSEVADSTPSSAFLANLTRTPGLAFGAALPESITVLTLAGAERSLRTYQPKGRPMVVVLGSLSSPTFRDRLGDLAWLRREVGLTAEIVVVYTAEQHPVGGDWQPLRNMVDNVAIPPHADADARVDLLKRAMALAHAGDVTFVADGFDDAAKNTLIGDEPAVAALVFAPDGTLSGRQRWFDPTGIPGLVEAASR